MNKRKGRLLREQDRPMINTPTKGMDNTIMTETSDIDKEAILTWCAQVRALRAEVGNIEDDDPRMAFLREHCTWAEGSDPNVRGDAFFALTVQVPEQPVAVPSWARTVRVDLDDYPYVFIEWTSEEPSGEWQPYFLQSIGICVEDSGGGRRLARRAGEVFYGPADPMVEILPALDLQELETAREVLTGLAKVFEKVGL